MKRCNVKPYEGTENYIFISYCHKDRANVFPIIEQLVKDGFRVWYDEGIDPGEEWPEIIAKHLNECSSCMAFISKNSLNSHNCRREVNFALLKKKFFISIVLEPVEMSLGMEMQLSAYQSIFKYNLNSELEFFSKLYDAKQLNECLGTPNSNIKVSSSSDYEEDDFDTSKIRDPFSSSWFVEGASLSAVHEGTITESNGVVLNDTEFDEEFKKAEEAEKIAAEELRIKNEEVEKLKKIEMERLAAEEKRRKEEETERILAEEKRQKAEDDARLAAERLERLKAETERLREIEASRIANNQNKTSSQLNEIVTDSDDAKVSPIKEHHHTESGQPTQFYLKREKTGQVINILYGSHVIGRSVTLARYLVEGNKMMGRTHATIIATYTECLIVDNNSLNKTFINGSELEPNVRYSLENGDVLKIGTELFVFYSN